MREKEGWRKPLVFLDMDMLSFSGVSAGKESACNAGDLGLIPGLGRSPGEGKGPLLYSGLENSMDHIVHGVAKSPTWLSDFHTHTHTHRYRQRFVLNKTFKCKQNSAVMWLYIVCILFKEGWLLLGKVSKLLKLKKKNFNKKQSCFFFFWRNLEMRGPYTEYGLMSFLRDKSKKWLCFQNLECMPWRAMWNSLHFSSHKGQRVEVMPWR